MKKLFILGSGVFGVIPLSVFAANQNQNGILGILYVLGKIFNYMIPVLISLAVVWFIWGVILYLISGNEDKKKKSKEVILSGIIGLFIIVSIWGILKLVIDTFGVGPERLNQRAIPCIPNPAAEIDCN